MANGVVRMGCDRTNVRLYEMRQKVVQGFFNLLWNRTPTLSKAVVKRMLFTPNTYKSTPVERRYLENSERFEIPIHGKAVKCWKWGSRPQYSPGSRLEWQVNPITSLY